MSDEFVIEIKIRHPEPRQETALSGPICAPLLRVNGQISG
jgi:hypothetical protein